MMSGLGAITSTVVEFALDGLALRHNAIASNIANSNAIGYRPVKVSFEDKIAEILQTQNSVSPASSFSSQLMPQVSFGMPLSTEASRTMLDSNIVALNQNTVQYQALIKGLDKYLGSIADAIKEGKR